jgi:5'-nucleotidase
VPLDANVPGAPEVQAVVDQLKAGIVAQYGDVYQTKLAYAFWDIKTTYNPAYAQRDSGMGNLITDSLRVKTRTQIAITANGLISEGITKGYVVGADVFRPISYGYDTATGLGLKVATFKATGAELVKGLEVGLAYLGISEDFFLQVSGLSFKYDSRLAPGSRVILSSVKVGLKALDPAKVYTVSVNEGIAMLLPMMGLQVTELQILPDLEYNVLKDYITKLGVLAYSSQGRIKDVAAIATYDLEVESPATTETTDMQGGCSAAGAPPAAGLGLLALGLVALRLRRRGR